MPKLVASHGIEAAGAAAIEHAPGRRTSGREAPVMTAQPEPMTLDAFLRWEAGELERHEFSEGVVTAFAGGSVRHARLAAAVIGLLVAHLRGTRCRALTSDALVATPASGRYPDATVTCDERDLGDPAAISIRFPKLVCEVLSESTAAVDRGAKLDEYRAIASLEEYVLIDSRRRWTATYRRAGDAWIASLPQAAGTLRLASIGLEIDVAALYADAGLGPEA